MSDQEQGIDQTEAVEAAWRSVTDSLDDAWGYDAWSTWSFNRMVADRHPEYHHELSERLRAARGWPVTVSDSSNESGAA